MKINPLYFLTQSHSSSEQGYSLIENLAAFAIFAILVAATSPLFLGHRENMIKSEWKNGAISLSERILDQMRGDGLLNVTGTTVTPQTEENFGYEYQVSTYICAEEPQFNDDGELTECSINVKDENKIRHVYLKIEKNGATVYEVQTAQAEIKQGI